MPESLWVAVLHISEATAQKLSGRHNVDANDVRDAIECVSGLSYTWDDDPGRGLRALVEITIGKSRVVAVLYPVDDPVGDVYALGSAYQR